MSKYALLIDFGSTYTKVCVVDIEKELIAATSKAKTTVETDVMVGLNMAMASIKDVLDDVDFEIKLACSSAAGGLRMAAIGLVPDLTVKAATAAALNAGAKLALTFAYKMSKSEIEKLVAGFPDIVLLAGGTDGGNSEVILHNAKILAQSEFKGFIIIAGNKSVAEEVGGILESAGKNAIITENVLPTLDKMNIEPTRAAIQGVFINRIIQAKGIKAAEVFVNNVLMPTPNSVLRAASLLSKGTKNEKGLGDLLVFDVGGATTDVYSICEGYPSKGDIIIKGLQEPEEKRTVEGDLGVRYNAQTIMSLVGEERLGELAGTDIVAQTIKKWSQNVENVPQNPEEKMVDFSLAASAVTVALNRHAGFLEEIKTLTGRTYVQYGKDLRDVKNIIGTGGPLIHAEMPEDIFKTALEDNDREMSLKPEKAKYFIDRSYFMYAMGLLSTKYPDVALRIMKKYLVSN